MDLQDEKHLRRIALLHQFAVKNNNWLRYEKASNHSNEKENDYNNQPFSKLRYMLQHGHFFSLIIIHPFFLLFIFLVFFIIVC